MGVSQRQGPALASRGLNLSCSRLLGKAEHAQVRLLRAQKTLPRNKLCKPVQASTVELERDVEKENSRQYRRTVFTFDNWAAHRSVKRYRRHIVTLFQSRIVRGLLKPLATLTAIATAVATYETLRAETDVLAGFPAITFEQTAPISSVSFALSLLLVFRTNTSYGRWDESRKLWGGITNRTRDIVRQAISFVPSEEPEVVEMFKRWTIAYPKTLMCHLRENEDLNAVLADVLRPEELEALNTAAHKPNYVLQVLSEINESSAIVSASRFRIDQNFTFLHDAHGACERILKTPIPLSYTRHTSRFLVIWLALLPFTLWKSCGLAMVPATTIISFLLLGIEEIGVQIEEPFSILPLEAISTTIQTNCLELADKRSNIKKMVGPVMQKSASRNGNSNGSDKREGREAYAMPDVGTEG